MPSPDGPTERTGLAVLDLGVLSALHDASLFPSGNHAPTARVLDRIVASGLCGSEDAEAVITRLGSPWLLPLPLIDVHGNNGTQYRAPTQPLYTEVRLTAAGQLAVESSRAEIPPLPVGLINGDIHLVLGRSFGRWKNRPDHNPPGVAPVADRPLQLQPGFDPERLIAGLIRLLDDPSVSGSEVIEVTGAPRLLAFSDPKESLEELLTTGQQVLSLTPTPDPDAGNLMHPPADIELSFGMSLPDPLRKWITRSNDPGTSLTADHLGRLASASRP